MGRQRKFKTAEIIKNELKNFDMSQRYASVLRSQLRRRLYELDPDAALRLGYRPNGMKVTRSKDRDCSGAIREAKLQAARHIPEYRPRENVCVRCSRDDYKNRLCRVHFHQMERRRLLFLNGLMPRFVRNPTKQERAYRRKILENFKANRQNPIEDNRADIMPSEGGYDPREGLTITTVPSSMRQQFAKARNRIHSRR